MTPEELRKALESSDADVMLAHSDGGFTKLDKDQLIDMVWFFINWRWLRDDD